MRFLLPAAVLLLAACASGPTGPEAAKRFDSFQAVQTDDFTGYSKVQVLSLSVSPEIEARVDARTIGRDRERPISRRDLDEKLGDFRADIERRLATQAELVEEGGPGILTVRTIVTELDANRPTMAELADNPGLSIQSLATGAAAARVELSEDGKLLAVIEDEDNVTSLQDQTVLNGAIWQTADRYFARLADKLAALLEG
ncbi:DUF3313 family protein [Parvularcula sp. ZS-1/3]|uniref:DUF3313 family protein n=1 Tax=Parvularcula mediterranea TaxID=2732508 RepID=A0A7Y3RK27_9PROT|nr:DUF3313 family protein [Parvularcula mediterranea]NNU15430.1 DUF3313 family protein [Parvularcula mediterranea]